MGALVEDVDPLQDPRHGNAGRHSLHDILVIALCTILCGGETCTDMALFGQSKREFLESLLPLRNGIPSHDTFSRVFRLLDPEAFRMWFMGFMGQFAQGCEGVLAIDGKTLRRSYDRAEAQSPLHLVNAWAAKQRLVLGQLAVDGKSNEITAVPKLLEMLALPGMVVTADAMHCQRQLSRQVLDQGADSPLTKSVMPTPPLVREAQAMPRLLIGAPAGSPVAPLFASRPATPFPGTDSRSTGLRHRRIPGRTGAWSR